MANSNIADAMIGAAFGVGIGTKLTSWKRDVIAGLKVKILSLLGQTQEFEAQLRNEDLSPDSVVDTAEAKIKAIADGAAACLPMAGEEEHAARQSQTVFRITHNLLRRPVKVDMEKSLQLFAALAAVEGLATALFFLSGGFVSGITEAIGFGLTISSINILLSGFVGGGFFGKYWSYGLNAREDDPQFKKKRIGGRIGSVVVIIMITTLLLASGIVRATGETEGLTYSLDAIEVAARNFHALLLWGLGISFSILSWRKGLSAFSDPYPDFTKESQALALAQDDIQSLFEDALDDIELISEETIRDVKDMAQDVANAQQSRLDELHNVRIERENVLAAISQAKNDFAAFYAEQAELHHMVSRGLIRSQPPDDDHDLGQEQFDTSELLAQVPDIAIEVMSHSSAFANARNAALKRLASTKKSAIQTLSSAYQAALR